MLLIKTGTHARGTHAKGGINNQFLITRFSISLLANFIFNIVGNRARIHASNGEINPLLTASFNP